MKYWGREVLPFSKGFTRSVAAMIKEGINVTCLQVILGGGEKRARLENLVCQVSIQRQQSANSIKISNYQFNFRRNHHSINFFHQLNSLSFFIFTRHSRINGYKIHYNSIVIQYCPFNHVLRVMKGDYWRPRNTFPTR